MIFGLFKNVLRLFGYMQQTGDKMTEDVATSTPDVAVPQTQEFSHDRYQSYLELLLKSAQDEYKAITIDIRKYQGDLMKNYIWISFLIISAISGLIVYINGNKQEFYFIYHVSCSSVLLYILVTLSLLSSLYVFVIGINTMRGRGYVASMYDDRPYMEIARMAYEESHGRTDMNSTIISMINYLESGINENLKDTKRKAMSMRNMSISLLCSSLSLFIFVIMFFIVFVRN